MSQQKKYCLLFHCSGRVPRSSSETSLASSSTLSSSLLAFSSVSDRKRKKEKQNTRRAHRYKLSRLTYPCLSTLLLGILLVNFIGTTFRIPSYTSTSTACFLHKHNSSRMGKYTRNPQPSNSGSPSNGAPKLSPGGPVLATFLLSLPPPAP